MLIKILILPVVFALVASEKLRFDNYTLYRITPDNVQQIKILQDIQNTETKYDFWTDPAPSVDFVSVMSSPQDRNAFENILNENNIRFTIPMENVQEAIDKEKVGKYTRSSRTMEWNQYYTLDEINAWLDDMVRAYPGVASNQRAGASYMNRDIRGIRISHGDGRRAIFVEGGIHAREWISPSTVCYIINELLTSTDPETMAAAHEFDWYLFPVTNPDGYVWTHGNSRMWRKNTRPIGNNIYGVDLNRNWNNNWLVTGASTNPASDQYAGPGPFSEPETRNLADFILSHADRIDLYLSFHSFRQLLMIPFGNSTEPYANYHDAMNIGRRAVGALSVRYGTQYITGNIAEAIYHATGGSIDWVKDHLKVPLVYCYELRDRGQYGFLLPEDQILPNNQETMDSVVDLIHQAKRFGYMKAFSSGTSLVSSFTLLLLSAFYLLLN